MHFSCTATHRRPTSRREGSSLNRAEFLMLSSTGNAKLISYLTFFRHFIFAGGIYVIPVSTVNPSLDHDVGRKDINKPGKAKTRARKTETFWTKCEELGTSIVIKFDLTNYLRNAKCYFNTSS